MTYAQYRKLKQDAYERMMRARHEGDDAVLSGDVPRMQRAMHANDAAYLAFCKVQDRAREITDLPQVDDIR